MFLACVIWEMGNAKRERKKRKSKREEREGKKKSHVTARDVLDQWQKAPQAQPAAGVAIAEKGTHFPFIKTELASRFFRLLVRSPVFFESRRRT